MLFSWLPRFGDVFVDVCLFSGCSVLVAFGVGLWLVCLDIVYCTGCAC